MHQGTRGSAARASEQTYNATSTPKVYGVDTSIIPAVVGARDVDGIAADERITPEGRALARARSRKGGAQ